MVAMSSMITTVITRFFAVFQHVMMIVCAFSDPLKIVAIAVAFLVDAL
jgi:hypothetical protein